MVGQFEVIEGRLLQRGLEVCEQVEDFEWKVYAMLPVVVDDFDLGKFTSETFVECVRDNFHIWHLDSTNRASTILSDFNFGPSIAPFSFLLANADYDVPPSYSTTLSPASGASSFPNSFSEDLIPEESMRVDSEDRI
ncbi:hypothetical protein GGU11DRAFT_760742 [Lentinula aff. detonsa]|nr:hypothetical protein GGU11DRAFT_760742 [Lentinula aff. detonsa]